MPRNGSDGTFSLADVVTPATLADAVQVMTILNDLASEMTSSIAKDGQTPLTGQLKGLVSANPVYSFNGDSNTGVGSDTPDVVYLMAGGTKIATVAAGGINVLSGTVQQAGANVRLVGEMIAYVGTDTPTGWVRALGSSIGDASSGATERANADTFNLYSLIWAVSNNANGEGQTQDSSGTNVARGASALADFNAHKRILLPNMQGRSFRGADGLLSNGQTLGSDTVTIAQGNLPAVNFVHSGTVVADSGHGHGINDPGHTHNILTLDSSPQTPGAGSASAINAGVNSHTSVSNTTGITVQSGTANVSVTAQGTAASGGSGVALTTTPKQLVRSFLIKL